MLARLKQKQVKQGSRTKSFYRADTLIEVLFAITTMSLVIVLSLSLMNQGTSASIRSIQITLARQEIDSQAETLRYLNSAYVAAYTSGSTIATGSATAANVYKSIITDIEASGATSVSTFGTIDDDGVSCATPPSGGFILNTNTAKYQAYSDSKLVLAETYPQIVYNSDGSIAQSQGVWIEAIRSSKSNGSQYTDFHIRACWSAQGVSQPMNLGTIVRLYDPAN